MNKVLSLIVPVYNMEKYLEKCLASVLVPEKAGCYEVIIVNDGSTDSSINIARKYETMYPSIYIVVDKENGGYGSCFNIGIKIATGKYFKMLDSDDWFLSSFPSYIDMLKHRDDDVIVNGVLEVEDGKTQGKSNAEAFPYSQGNVINLNDSNYFSMFIHNFAFRVNTMKDCICPERLLYTDTIITLHGLFKANSAYCFGKDLYCYRIGRKGQSTDTAVSFKHLDDYLKVADQAYTSFPDLSRSMIARGVSAYQMERISFFCLQGICLKKICKPAYLEYKRIHNRMVNYSKYNGCKFIGKTVRLSTLIPFFYFIWHIQLKLRT